MFWTFASRILVRGSSARPLVPRTSPRAVGTPIELDSVQVDQAEEGLEDRLRAIAEADQEAEKSRVVWVVDDDVAVLALMKSLFGREGYQILSSTSVKDAMEVVGEASAFDLVVLDFNIPGGSGLDVLREFRKISDVPVLMISNVRRPELVEQAFDLGADDFVEKPFNPRSLVVRARHLME